MNICMYFSSKVHKAQKTQNGVIKSEFMQKVNSKVMMKASLHYSMANQGLSQQILVI